MGQLDVDSAGVGQLDADVERLEFEGHSVREPDDCMLRRDIWR